MQDWHHAEPAAHESMNSPVSAERYSAANARGRQLLARSVRAESARYSRGRVVVELDNGCTLAFPPALSQGLAGARAADLSIIEITPSGLGLHWPRLDADLSVPGLIQGVLGSRQWMAQLGRAGGRVRSEAKAAAARANGARGGRPRGF